MIGITKFPHGPTTMMMVDTIMTMPWTPTTEL